MIGAGLVGLPDVKQAGLSGDPRNLTGEGAGGVGLSMYHISPRKLEEAKIGNRPEPKVILWRGASLVSAEVGKLKAGKGRRHDWKRGAIIRFSKQSRRRVLRIVATLKRETHPIFSTLTYPDEFTRLPRVVKSQLDKFRKRLLRKFPDAIVIWRMEAQVRKSGVNIGEIAPHFHMLIWNVSYENLLAWIPQNWYEVVGSKDKKHLMAGTRVERVRSTRGVLFYTAKYICKALDYELEGWGRYWGIFNRTRTHTGIKKLSDGKEIETKIKINNLKTIQGEREIMEIDGDTAMTILRYMRRKASEIYRKGKFVGRRKFPKSGHKFTLVCNADFWADAIPKIQAGCGGGATT